MISNGPDFGHIGDGSAILLEKDTDTVIAACLGKSAKLSMSLSRLARTLKSNGTIPAADIGTLALVDIVDYVSPCHLFILDVSSCHRFATLARPGCVGAHWQSQGAKRSGVAQSATLDKLL